MRFYIFLFLITVSFLTGCEPKEEKKPVAISIGDIEISADEFNEAYAKSYLVPSESPLTKEEYLDTFIKRRILLREAERHGLDRDEAFLKSVETFWQQSLLALVIKRQLREMSVTVDVAEEEIKKYYEEHKESFEGKTYEQKRERIKYKLMRDKQQRTLEAWINKLRNNADIKVDKKLLEM